MATTVAISPNITLAEGQGGVTWFVYTASRSGDLSGPTTLDYAVTGAGLNPASAADFQGGAFPGSRIWFGGGESVKQVWIPVLGDLTAESDEQFTVTLFNITGGSITQATATGAITNDDAVPPTQFGFAPSGITRVAEGNAGTTDIVFNLVRTGDLSHASSATWTVTGSGVPADGADFVGGVFPTGVVTFAAGQTAASITVQVQGDTAIETSEAFQILLSNPTGGELVGNALTGVIENDDATSTVLQLEAGILFLGEGDVGSTPATFTVLRTGDLSGSSSANWTLVAQGAGAVSPSDFVGGVLPSGVVSFAPGQASATATFYVQGDTLVESDEVFDLLLSNPVGASLGAAARNGRILNDDVAPSGARVAISPGVLSQVEGNGGVNYFVYAVTRSGDLSGPTTLDYGVTGSGANPANAADFENGVLPGNKVWFGGGESVKQIWIPVRGDTTPEADEQFTVTLSNIMGGSIGTATAQGTIVSDDGAPAVTLIHLPTNDLTLTEGTGQSTPFTWTLTRSGDLSGASSVDWSAATGVVVGSGLTPIQTEDFVGGVTSGTATFAPGQNTATVTLLLAGDATPENTEAFTLSFSNFVGGSMAPYPPNVSLPVRGVLADDDVNPAARVSIVANQTAIQEGQSGAANWTYTVTRTGDLTGVTTLGWSVAGNGSQPANGADFVGGAAPSGVVTFGVGESVKTVTIAIQGDAQVEPDETFAVLFQAPTGGLWSNSSGPYYDVASRAFVGTITNDDVATAPTLTVANPVSTLEGTGGITPFTFVVTRTGDLSAATTAAWSTSSVVLPNTLGAQASDFQGGAFPSGVVSFAAGQSTASIVVNVVADSLGEGEEVFALSLGAVTNGAWGNGGPIYTPINNDDGPRFSVSNVSLSEGNSGSTAYNFTLTKIDPNLADLNWVVEGTGANPATASDFVGGAWPVGGQVTFAPGQTTATVTVNVAGDIVDEATEQFAVRVYSASPIFGTAAGVGTIVNDDAFGGNVVNSGPGRDWYTSTAAADRYVFDAPSDGHDVVFAYDATNTDTLQFKVGPGAFVLANQATAGAATLVSATSASTSIAGADVVIWAHPWMKLTSAAQVDSMLAGQAGTFDGGVLVVALNDGMKATVYYDADANTVGGATAIVTLDNLTSPSQLNVSDFLLA